MPNKRKKKTLINWINWRKEARTSNYSIADQCFWVREFPDECADGEWTGFINLLILIPCHTVPNSRSSIKYFPQRTCAFSYDKQACLEISFDVYFRNLTSFWYWASSFEYSFISCCQDKVLKIPARESRQQLAKQQRQNDRSSEEFWGKLPPLSVSGSREAKC